MYKFCILTAGKGTRNAYAQRTNKSLLPVGNKLAIEHILDKVPEDIEIIIAVGHHFVQVSDAVNFLYPNRKKHFIYTSRYTGEGSGPGYSLLQCKSCLQCPFIFTACDTIVLENYPEPDENWIGVSLVGNTEPYLTVAAREGKVLRVYDKIKDSPSKLASIGVAGVKDYEVFWEGLNKPRLVNEEHQTTDGFNALISKGIEPVTFTWFDTGNTEEYEDADRYFSESVPG